MPVSGNRFGSAHIQLSMKQRPIASIRTGIEWLMDHRVLYLKSSPKDELPSFVLSLYTFRFARELGAGHLAFLRQVDGAGERVSVLADNLELARQATER